MSEVHQITIMISSTRADLMQYREEAANVIKRVAGDFERRVQLVEKSMEKDVQTGGRELAVDVSKRWVEDSDWIVLIVGWNYGTISSEPSAGGISVTEWEYRHAVKLGKKTFAFVVGEPGTVNEYRALREETKDLKDWKPEEHRNKLKSFKDSLASSHLEYFKNLRHFSERLEKTLREAIAPPVDPRSVLADLLLAVRPSKQQCIDRVKLIATCKRVHDHLHELHQNVIRPILESALIQWRSEGQLGMSVATMIANKAGYAEALVRYIAVEKQKLAAKGGNLLGALERVVARTPQCDFQERLPELEEFTRSVSRFAAAVQSAFTLTNTVMFKDANVLDDLHVSLLKHIGTARQRRRLSLAEEKKLDDELQRAERNKKHLIEVLDAHNGWQNQHDMLDKLNGFRRGPDFDEQVSDYVMNDSPQLISMIESERAALAQGSANPILANKLSLLSTNLAELCQKPVLSMFDSMRKTFDDAFYQIDKGTLAEVDGAEQRVRDLETQLEELARRQSEVA